MLSLDQRVAEAMGNPMLQEELLREYKPFILKCASDCCKRYVTDSDDEWSIALGAFHEALQKYSPKDGAFLAFGKLVIRRRLYDYFDANQKFRSEIPVSPSVFSGEEEDEESVTEVTLQVKKQLTYERDTTAADEIEAANGIFAQYGFTFFDLTECSPKAEKTKEACAKAAVFMLKSPILMNELRLTKQLPIKIIEKNTRLPRKIMERHRKYIIAVVELLSGEYPHLADYLAVIRKELSK
ncbi:MAG: RNA polymerase subunit sigma [Oscillospiraceae bacterium]